MALRLPKWLRNLITPTPSRRAMIRVPVGGGRVSYDDANSIITTGLQVVSQLSSDEYWRDNLLDDRSLDRVPAWRLMELLCELSPEISRARWDFLRMCNPGFEVTVSRPGSESEDAQGRRLVDEFLSTLKRYYGSVDVPISRLFTSAFLRGEMIAELVLDRDGQMADLATPDPRAFDFREIEDPVRGEIFRLGQWQNGQFKDLNYDTIQFIPIDPFPGKPRGVSMIGSALFSTLFLIGLLHDLRRVIAQQGWPRIDVAVKLENLLASLPDQITEDPEQVKEAINRAISEVQAAYSQLQPDDTYIHTDTVEVNRPVGTVDASSLGSIDGVISVLERMAVRALKTMPLMLGLTESTSEANANRQWEIYAAGIKSLQHHVETMLESLLQTGLRAAGRQATVRWRFAELRAAEMLRDAQVEALTIKNTREKYDAGWISQDEAAQDVTGHKADAPVPRQASSGSGGNLVGGNPDPGSNRSFQREIFQIAERVANARGDRNPAAVALLLAAAVNEPNSLEQAEAESWWRRNAPATAGPLIDAETVE